MVRHLFTLASAVSLLLFFATGVLFVRSFWKLDNVWWGSPSQMHCIEGWSEHGGLSISWCRSTRSGQGVIDEKGIGLSVNSFEGGEEYYRTPLMQEDTTEWHFAGFGHLRQSTIPYTPEFEAKFGRLVTTTWTFPLPLLSALLLLLPLNCTVKGRRYRLRSFRGHCPKCGYNLTGNTSGICPECGTPVAVKAKVIA